MDIVNQTSDAEIYPSIKVVNQGKDETSCVSYQPEDLHIKNLEGNAFRCVGQTKELRGKNDNIKNDYHPEVKLSTSTASFRTSFSSESSFSVFSDSSDDASNSPSSSDGASTTPSSGSSDHEKYNVRRHGESSNQVPITQRSGGIKPLDEENSATVPYNGTLTKPISNQSENQRSLYAMGSDATVSDRLAATSGASDFWEGALNYRWSESVKTESHVMNDHLTCVGSSLRRSSASFRKTENSFRIDGETQCPNKSVFKEVGVISLKSPIQLTSMKSRQARNVDNSVSSVSFTKPVRYSSSDDIIAPQNEKNKAEVQKLSNSKIPSSSKTDCTINNTSVSPVPKPRFASASNEDRTVYSVKRESAWQPDDVFLSQNATRSSIVAESVYSNDLDGTVQLRKSRLGGIVPSNSSERCVDRGRNVASSVTSNRSYSLKAVDGLKASTWKAVEHFKASKLSRDGAADQRHDNKVSDFQC